MYLNYSSTAKCVFRDKKIHGTYQRFLCYQNVVRFRGTRVILILFILVIKVKNSPQLFSLNSEILNSIPHRTPLPNLTKIG